MKRLAIVAAAAMMAGCGGAGDPETNVAMGTNAASAAAPAALSLTRLDCGTFRIKNFDAFFSDRPGLYSSEPRDMTDSCYLIRHGEQIMLWDTGLSADLLGKKVDIGDGIAGMDRTIVQQLTELKLTPADIDIVGISHHHDDHLGQIAQFGTARLIIGAGDFDKAKGQAPEGKPAPVAPWLKDGAQVTRLTADLDIFGDGSVVALHLPGHTPDHLALLVNLKSGPVLLSGDLYHSTQSREKRGVPPFNTDRAQTLASMDAFEAKAKATGAKVIIQHEPDDIAKLPAFPEAAQ